MSSIQNIPALVDVSWLSQHLEDPDLILLDASIKSVTAPDSEKSHPEVIPQALFFDLKKVFSDQSAALPNTVPVPQGFQAACRALGISQNSKVVVYDTKGIYSSPRVWFLFKVMGFDNVAILDGGLPAWIQAGFSTTNQYRRVPEKTGDFNVEFKPQLIVSADQVLNAIDHTEMVIIDARSHERFMATAPEPRADLKGGHIPGSINLPFTNLLENGKFINQDKLKAIIANLDLANKHLIFTCGSGITACILKFALERIGYKDASVYDGSWTEWGQLPNVPISK